MQFTLFTETKYRFFSLGSGSSGNCYYLGTGSYGILIDAGVGIRTVKKALREYGVALEKIVAVLVTHDHADHVKTIGFFGDKMSIPIFATDAVHEGIRRNKYINASFITSRRVIEKETSFSVKDFNITAFEVPHDSIDNVGYSIDFDGHTFVVATDIGRVTETIERYAKQASHLILESNYDEVMLEEGKYPYFLKKRITSGMGHLSNKHSAELIANIYSERLKHVWLCHLSQDNNHPELALKAAADALHDKGVIVGKDLKLNTLSRYNPSGLLDF